jgi:multicomponent Na+:H+ antiporter subunit G
MSEYFDLIAAILVLGGLFFSFIGAVGLIRLPDFYTRCHAAGITDTLGAGMVLVGLMFLSSDPMVHIKLGLVAVFLLLTSPTASHAISNAAYTRGLVPWARSVDAREPARGEDTKGGAQ